MGKRPTIMALANQKGGVGKSISASNLAVAFTLLGKRTLMVDLDSQGNSSSNLGLDAYDEVYEGKTIYEALVGQIKTTTAIYEISPTLDIIPANLDLAAAELELLNMNRREYRLQKALAQLEKLDYDIILIDCPPSLGILTINALTAADVVYVPIQPKKHAVKGFVRLTQTIAAIQGDELNPKLRFGGSFLTMFDGRRSLDIRIQQDLRAVNETYTLFNTPIRETTVLAQAEDAAKSIFDYAPKSNGALDYLSLAKEILEKEATNG